MDTNMQIEIHAPSIPVLLVSLVLAALALICYFLVPTNPVGFWAALMAYVLMALGSTVKT
jgi:hypothetical protein